MKTITLTIERPDGQTEELEVSKRFPKINQKIFDTIKTQTSKANRGNVLKAVVKETKNNLKKLRVEYNNLHNEGGEGFIPSLKNSPDYKEWTDTTTFA